MKRDNYESPKMNFVNLRVNKAIANECWKYAKINGDDPLYYDTPGTGYVKFSVSGSSNCSAGNTALKYEITAFMKPDNTKMTAVEEKAARDAFDKWFEEDARPNGPSFKGAGYSEDTADPTWS